MYYIYIISYLYIDYTSDFWSVESEWTKKPFGFFPWFSSGSVVAVKECRDYCGYWAQSGPQTRPFCIFSGWWFGTWIFMTFHILGMSSSQLTFTHIFQRGRYTTTIYILMNHRKNGTVSQYDYQYYTWLIVNIVIHIYI